MILADGPIGAESKRHPELGDSTPYSEYMAAYYASKWVRTHPISVTTLLPLLFHSVKGHNSTLAFFRRIRIIPFDLQPLCTVGRAKLFDIIDGF